MNGTSRSIALLFAGLAMLQGLPARGVNKDTPGYFEFVMPWFDVSESFTDMSALNARPAGAHGRITIREGHFHDASGKRLRLLGTNLCWSAAFPAEDKAPLIARRLRKLGFNAVRFHHFDGPSVPRGVWRKDRSGFDPQQIERLDRLIHHLKQCGIYIDINLHVSRTYPGLAEDLPRSFRYGKGLDQFMPRLIQLQKDYARRLLTHRNPHTKTTYAAEPAVFCIEINNENALTTIPWDDLRALPDPFAGELTSRWHTWLRKRHQDTAALRSCWNEADEPLGEELLTNGDFASGTKGWMPQATTGARMTLHVVEDPKTPNGKALKIETREAGKVQWSQQLHQTRRDLANDRPYTLTFRARADKPRRLNVSVLLDKSPWRSVGLRARIQPGPSWKRYAYTFKSRGTEPKHSRVTFNFNNQVGTFWLADVSLRPGGVIGLGEGQSLEAGNIPIPPHNASDAQRTDYARFLMDTEQRYVREMMGFLKEDLGVRAHVLCTQVSYGGPAGLLREGTLSDVIDMHAYWQHPAFPAKPWDRKDWYIPNTSMVACRKTGTLGRLAWHRMFGKPFTVSEYNHPAPNDYAAEMFGMLASFAAFQDWDGVFQFNYATSVADPAFPRIAGYFTMYAHPAQLAFVPIAALMFRMGVVRPGEQPLVASVPTQGIATRIHSGRPRFDPAYELPTAAGLRPVGFRLEDRAGPIRLAPIEPPTDRLVSDTGEIAWEPFHPKRAVYTVNAPAIRYAVGILGGREIELGDVTIRVTKATNDWAAVAVGALDGRPIAESNRILVVAVGRVENTDMGWNDDRTSVGTRWGKPPIVAEGIGASIALPNGRTVQALDGTGRPKGEVPSNHKEGRLAFRIGPQYETIWYAVTR